jgi:S-adenosylmethionine synthetase
MKYPYFSSSEYVSPGHPDRLCDVLAAIIIQDIQKQDGVNSHAAIEVFATRDLIIFGGEATTTISLTDEYLRSVVEQGFKMCGYISQMRNFWTKDEVTLAEDVEILNKIYPQSPDIAIVTTDKGEDSGFNDQGVFFSSAENTNHKRLGSAMFVAEIISKFLHQLSLHSIIYQGSKVQLGPDNKCVVTVAVEEDGFTPICITAITIAVAHSSQSSIEKVRECVKKAVSDQLIMSCDIPISPDCDWIINGTGRFVYHGVVSDTSLTGRKISVNHPSAGPIWSNKMIGGGSLTKPAKAADLVLNLTSRFIASVIVQAGLSDYATVGCSGAIGQHYPQSFFIKGDPQFEEQKEVKEYVISFFKNELPWAPIKLARLFGIFDDHFDFSLAVYNNFFGDYGSQPWESNLLITDWAIKLSSGL